jgi:hypothetical protein
VRQSASGHDMIAVFQLCLHAHRQRGRAWQYYTDPINIEISRHSFKRQETEA